MTEYVSDRPPGMQLQYNKSFKRHQLHINVSSSRLGSRWLFALRGNGSREGVEPDQKSHKVDNVLLLLGKLEHGAAREAVNGSRMCGPAASD
jgi:hypothetical protein